jgi:hypothetical protein
MRILCEECRKRIECSRVRPRRFCSDCIRKRQARSKRENYARTFNRESGHNHVFVSAAELTYREIAAIVQFKHGWKMSKSRVQQICVTAEKKLAEALAGYG